MSNAFADIQTVYKTNYDYSSVNSNIHSISVECKLSSTTTANVTIIKYTEMQKYETRLVLGWVTVCKQGKPSRYMTNHQGQLSLQSLRGKVNRVPACLAGVKAGRVHLCRVAGCDPVWQVTLLTLRWVTIKNYSQPFNLL